MANELVINTTSHEIRVALIENGTIAELYIERTKVKGIVGNIYKGRVVRVLPGMQAAFVDIGLEKAAFLYVADVFDPLDEFESFLEGNGKKDESTEGESPDFHPMHPIEDPPKHMHTHTWKLPVPLLPSFCSGLAFSACWLHTSRHLPEAAGERAGALMGVSCSMRLISASTCMQGGHAKSVCACTGELK